MEQRKRNNKIVTAWPSAIPPL